MATKASATGEARWASRIVKLDKAVPPDQLLANPLNARRHPGEQRTALRAALDQIGWVGVVTVNQTTGMVIDGHARIEEALSAGEPTVPVLYVKLTEDEERAALATFDAITDLAVYDRDVWTQLLDGLTLADPLAEMVSRIDAIDAASLDAIGSGAGTGGAPDDFREYGEDIATEHKCPSCGFEW